MNRGRGEKEAGRRGAKAPTDPVSPSSALPVAGPVSLITLLTDFGTGDYFAGAMKGVILSLNSRARIVDITHEIPPQDIASAAFTLLAAYRSFPACTIHVAVVDPGVGTSRRPILVTAGNQCFVGPDNGIFSYIIERERRVRIVHLTNEKYFRHPVSSTFHGRDIFAAVAGALSCGEKPGRLGVLTTEYVQLSPLAPEILGPGKVSARIIHIDRFGNCVTNLTPEDLTPRMINGGARLTIKGKSIRAFRRSFATDSNDPAKLFGVWGSAGFLEVAATNRSAAKLLQACCGDTVLVSTKL